MPRAAVRILHPEPGEDAGELTRLVARARSIAAKGLAARFRTAGAEDVGIVGGPPDGLSFGARLRGLVGELRPGDGLVVLGSGSIVLAGDDDLGALIATATSGERRALTNNRYSSDVVAIGDAAILASVPELPSDNALPRWLETRAATTVEELPDRDRLGLDIDSPLDLELLRRHPACPPALADLARSMAHRLSNVALAFDELGAIARNPAWELLVAGRLSASTLCALEERAACRIRALVEERGLRASTSLSGKPAQRRSLGLDFEDEAWQPASVLGLLIDAAGPSEIPGLLHRLADGAVIDTRVLLAHRSGVDEAGWPSAEDRYASDLLLPDRVRDPWLRGLTLASRGAVPVAFGGHSLIGPGLLLALGLDR